MPPNQSNSDYDFILNHQQTPKKKIALGGFDGKKRMVVIACAAIIGFIVAVMLLSALLGGGGVRTAELRNLAASQHEIIRVSDLALEKAKDPATLAFLQTTMLSLQSEQNQVVNFLKDKGVKTGEGDLNRSKNSANDTQLSNAEQGSRYDEQATALIKDLLVAYQTSIKKSFDSASDKSEKELLDNLYQQVSLLTD